MPIDISLLVEEARLLAMEAAVLASRTEAHLNALKEMRDAPEEHVHGRDCTRAFAVDVESLPADLKVLVDRVFPRGR
jgi:hypothetical protein